jgi:hypothetical protein
MESFLRRERADKAPVLLSIAQVMEQYPAYAPLTLSFPPQGERIQVRGA